MTGFTLIEVMITVAIVGIIAAIALPSYSQHIIRANRADAQDKLTEVMFQQERYIKSNRTYVTTLSSLAYANDTVPSNEGLYNITAAVCAGTAISRCVNLTATPVQGSRQANDGTITLNSRGAKTHDGNTDW